MARKVVTEKTFWAVKTLIAGGAALKEAADFFELSYYTVSKMNCSETYDEYKNIQAAYHIKERKKAEAKEKEEAKEKLAAAYEASFAKKQKAQEVHISDNLKLEMLAREQIELAKKQNELLTLISDTLAYIVTELTTTPPKED